MRGCLDRLRPVPGVIVVLVPVKRLELAKSRLAAALGDRERRDLVLALVTRTIGTVRDSRGADVIALVTPERSLADQLAVEWVPDAGSLNASLEAGVTWAGARGATTVLILPADLPWLAAEDITAVLAAGGGRKGVTLAPCMDGGTGALLLSPPDAIPPSFGPGSFARHARLARDRGVAMRVVRRNGLARDLDTPADLEVQRAEGAMIAT